LTGSVDELTVSVDELTG